MSIYRFPQLRYFRADTMGHDAKLSVVPARGKLVKAVERLSRLPTSGPTLVPAQQLFIAGTLPARAAALNSTRRSGGCPVVVAYGEAHTTQTVNATVKVVLGVLLATCQPVGWPRPPRAWVGC